MKHRLRDGSHAITLPGGKRQQGDDSLHAAGVRELVEEVGLSESAWREWVVKGPDVYALPATTYYVYHLSRTVPKVTMSRAFRARAREEAQKITDAGKKLEARVDDLRNRLTRTFFSFFDE